MIVAARGFCTDFFSFCRGPGKRRAADRELSRFPKPMISVEEPTNLPRGR